MSDAPKGSGALEELELVPALVEATTRVEYPSAVDLASELRHFNVRELGEKRQVTITRFPQSVSWAIELLKQEARQTETATVAFLLKRARSLMWKDVGPIRKARNSVLASGAESRHFLGACPPPELALGNAGERRFVARIPEELLAHYATLAGTLGLGKHQSYVLSVAMCAGLLNARIVPVADRPSIAQNVQGYRALVAQRLRLTGTLAHFAQANTGSQLEPWGLDDLQRSTSEGPELQPRARHPVPTPDGAAIANDRPKDSQLTIETNSAALPPVSEEPGGNG